MPTKALLYAAEVMHLASHAEPWGIRAEDVSFNFTHVMKRKNALIKSFADYREQQLGNGKFKFIRAMARFVDAHTVELSNGQKLSAAHFVIATGSKVAPSPLPQLNQLNYLTSDTALELASLPKSLVVLGGGAVAIEFAQFFARFGVRVSLVQRSPNILHEFDSDAAQVVEEVFRREGISLYTKTKLLDARKTGTHKEVAFEHNSQTTRIHADEVLYALGRTPNLATLGLEKIGVQIEYGRIATDSRMQTSVPHIYAAGGCAGYTRLCILRSCRGKLPRTTSRIQTERSEWITGC